MSPEMSVNSKNANNATEPYDTINISANTDRIFPELNLVRIVTN